LVEQQIPHCRANPHIQPVEPAALLGPVPSNPGKSTLLQLNDLALAVLVLMDASYILAQTNDLLAAETLDRVGEAMADA
jgi:hypothetical protein